MKRPTAKELLRHSFIKKARRTTYLIELIERYREWKLRGGAGQQSESESSSDDDDNNDTRHDAGGWVDTIRDKHNVLLSSHNNNTNNNNENNKTKTNAFSNLADQDQHQLYSSNGNSHSSTKINSNNTNQNNNNNNNHFYKQNEDDDDDLNGARRYSTKLVPQNETSLFTRTTQNVIHNNLTNENI